MAHGLKTDRNSLLHRVEVGPSITTLTIMSIIVAADSKAMVIVYFDYIKQVLRYLFNIYQDVQSLWKKLLKSIQLTEKVSHVVSILFLYEIICVGFCLILVGVVLVVTIFTVLRAGVPGLVSVIWVSQLRAEYGLRGCAGHGGGWGEGRHVR